MLDFSLINKIKINGITSKSEYLVNVGDTKYRIPISIYKEYLLGVDMETYKKAESYLLEYIIPYVESKRYPKYSVSSYRLKHLVEREIGEYVNNEVVKFIMAIHTVPTVRMEVEHPVNPEYAINKKYYSGLDKTVS